MQQLSRYIFKQLFFTIFAATIVLTSIMWLAQSLRYIDLIANKGVPLLLFLEMILYLLPNLVVIVAPIAVLIGVLFIYNKLITDHELVVMQASGLGYWQLAKPAILISLFFTFFIYLFTLYILPLSFRQYREITLALREKSLTSLVQVGQFNTFGKYTVYAQGQDSAGNFLGVIIYDGSQGDKSFLFMAEKGLVFSKEEGGNFLLINGNRQEEDVKTGKPSILYFDRYAIEPKEKPSSGEKGGRVLKTYERYVGDLLNPQESISLSTRLEFLSAAHQRLISPLYALAFGLLGVCCMILGHFNRKGQARRILIACIVASLIEIGAMVFLHTLKYANTMIILSYGLIIITICLCIFSLLKTEFINASLKGRRS
ncbi:MAG: LptF/LptG family permease [Alphaproteobacteria bacterium]|nr:LptF/LptG family permease [Alphaproteobacteria bacterium]MBP9776558.1 LptF/LptG family permease [Alphaproteobacteria bacterium]MDP3441519.1 LptF/LptG family permease [Ignavibacteria bacterium]